jgi:GNAT superfamily N-acetyltransferase
MIDYARAVPSDAAECVALRGKTRENSISVERLRSYGITVDSWATDIHSGALPGWIARDGSSMAGYCFGASSTGEVVVLALLPQHEGQGIGKHLLSLTVKDLRALGHVRLYLGCNPDPSVRSHGFYRRLGWRSTGQTDAHGDEVLELLP